MLDKSTLPSFYDNRIDQLERIFLRAWLPVKALRWAAPVTGSIIRI
jgi:hypothetical protein